VEGIAAELSGCYRPLPTFAAATGLRPEEWQALERRDVDRRARVANVLRTVSDGEVVELAKTSVSRRQVPLSRRARGARRATGPA
jgi:integrase